MTDLRVERLATNLVAAVSAKGGPGKTGVAVVIGDELSSRLPNQRISAIDCNRGGAAVDAVAATLRRASAHHSGVLVATNGG